MRITGPQAVDAFAIELCQQLGIDHKNVYSVELVMEPRNAVHVNIGMFIEKTQLEGIQRMMRRYDLQPILLEETLEDAPEQPTE